MLPSLRKLFAAAARHRRCRHETGGAEHPKASLAGSVRALGRDTGAEARRYRSAIKRECD
jgi:hypothetical protein